VGHDISNPVHQSSSLTTRQRERYQEVWQTLDHYGDHAPGEAWLPLFLDITGTTMRTSVLDAGCGSGKGALALQAAGFTRITLCDLTDAGLVPDARSEKLPFVSASLWDDLRKSCGFHDWVYCCDVLEHVPTPFTMLVISRLLEVARRGVFLTISFVPDNFGIWVGGPLHETQQSFTAWRDQLATLGTVEEARDLLIAGAFLVKPQKRVW
jgi:2-polyprenyl-3-methyl-5-hydroxy-6-metoxy-1,4-benzoquinol methylase